MCLLLHTTLIPFGTNSEDLHQARGQDVQTKVAWTWFRKGAGRIDHSGDARNSSSSTDGLVDILFSEHILSVSLVVVCRQGDRSVLLQCCLAVRLAYATHT